MTEDSFESDEHADDTSTADAAFTAPRVVALVLLSLLPFWLVPTAHILSSPDTATGFFHYELPYYVANGRAAFERGNGLLYPNPYDPAATAPSIYVHWLPWLLGALTVPLGFDPGDVILILTLVASVAFALATRAVVNHRLHEDQPRQTAFLAAMWGGGLLAIAGTIASTANGTSWPDSVLKFDPGNGLWFLNWGRNALFPTEAVYHILVVLCWLAEIRRQQTTANLLLLALATTHPWSGLELLLVINLWRGLEFLRQQERQRIRQLALSGSMLVCFLGYYKLWLPAFPQHAELQSVWELNWSLSWTSAGLAYGLVVLPAVLVIRKRWQTQSLDRTDRFLLCALLVAVGLAFHDRLIKPVQPIHFTRGYVWMPLFLLGLPLYAHWWVELTKQRRRSLIVIPLVLLLVCADNGVFSFVHIQRQLAGQDGFYLDRDERAMCREIHELPATVNRTVLTESSTLNYLIPTYARVRPWLGHQFNTPQYPRRTSIWEACFQNGEIMPDQIPADVDVLVIRRERSAAALVQTSFWKPIGLRNSKWEAYQRHVPRPGLQTDSHLQR